MHLPSKKLAPILVACVIAIAGIVVAYLYSPKNKTLSTPEKVLSLTAESQNLNTEVNTKDSDKDGLPDWEESILSTNPQKADSDGDGTSDGEETKTGRNPLVKGPNDKIGAASTTASNTLATDTSKKGTATDTLAKELFSKYMSIKQAGGTLSPEIQNQIAADVISQTTFGVSEAKIYSRQDLIITDDSATTLRIYGNALGTIFINNSLKNVKNELQIVEDAFNNQDKKEIAQLDLIIGSYQKILNQLVKTPVPSTAVSLHVNMLNNFSQLIEVDQGMRKLFDDPVITLAALQRYQDLAAEDGTILVAFKVYFDAKKIYFGQGEPGYAFTHIMG